LQVKKYYISNKNINPPLKIPPVLVLFWFPGAWWWPGLEAVDQVINTGRLSGLLSRQLICILLLKLFPFTPHFKGLTALIFQRIARQAGLL
jgi:hypothetical protein